MITCPECHALKPDRDFAILSQGKTTGYHPTCRACRTMPLPERVAMQEKAKRVQSSTVSKMAGTYVPPAWQVRAGSEAFLRIKSRWV